MKATDISIGVLNPIRDNCGISRFGASHGYAIRFGASHGSPSRFGASHGYAIRFGARAPRLPDWLCKSGEETGASAQWHSLCSKFEPQALAALMETMVFRTRLAPAAQ